MNAFLTAIFDTLFAPVSRWDPGWVLTLFSLATALVMLVVFRAVSNPEAIRRAKGKVVAHVLAIRLFPDDPWITVRSLGGALLSNVGYLRHAAVPILVMIVPVVLILLQLDLRFARRPLAPGETALVGITFPTGAADRLPDVALKASEGLIVERGPLRVPSLGEIDWRIRASAVGRHELRFEWGGRRVAKEVLVDSGRPLEGIASARIRGSAFGASLFEPGEAPLDGALGVERVAVDYPPRSFEILGFRMHWLVGYFVLSLAFAFLLKRPLGVEA